LPYILLFLFAGGGAGDAKVMGAIGAWLGAVNGLFVLASVSLAGVALAVVFALKRRNASALIAKLAACAFWTVALATGRGASSAKEDLKDMEALGKMPYGLAILVGVWVAGAGILIYRW
jgi:Flp pilus assembly protein protease CpaA